MVDDRPDLFLREGEEKRRRKGEKVSMYFILMETARHLNVSNVLTHFLRKGHFKCQHIWKLATDLSH